MKLSKRFWIAWGIASSLMFCCGLTLAVALWIMPITWPVVALTGDDRVILVIGAWLALTTVLLALTASGILLLALRMPRKAIGYSKRTYIRIKGGVTQLLG
jgi:Sec-independent protein secretion pathway component TatC|tara:strand:- start:1413 stop:1715 length:303 start_codon:yes stop_codon:yes gene_type:complete